MYIVGADSAFDHDLEKALFNIKCNTLSLLSLLTDLQQLLVQPMGRLDRPILRAPPPLVLPSW
jgi:hypothetical protein